MGVTDANSARSTSYTYDQLKRLTLAQTVDQVSANTWKLGFAYDRYGNRMSESILGGTAAMPSNLVLIDPATNHVISASYSYDADGDMTSDGLHTYSDDGEHRLNHVDGAANTYAYDGGGLRVNRNGNFYIYSAGKVIAEYAGGAVAASPTTEYVYARNKRVATINAGATTFHYWDHASIRSSANAAGSVVRTFGHFPFGEVWYETGAADKWKFTTYERDAESGLDYASARFHSSRLGRFMSLDPLPGDRKNPQSLNRYSYVRNNPISSSDPAGMEDCDDCDDSGGGGTPVYLQNECSMAMSCDGLGSGGQGGDSQGGDNQGNGDGGGSDQSQGPACDDSGNCQMPSSGDQGSSTPDYPWGPDSGDDSNTDSSNNNSDASAGPQCDENGDCTLPAQNKGPDVVDQAKQVNTVATWGMMVPGALLAAASIACAATPACALGAGAALISTLGVSGATLGFSGLVINALFGGTGAYSVVPSTSGCQVDICTGISSGAGAPPK